MQLLFTGTSYWVIKNAQLDKGNIFSNVKICIFASPTSYKMNLFEFLKDIKDSAQERVKTPITGAFTLSFLIYNWRPIVILIFSDTPISKRIKEINGDYSSWKNIVFPILIALFYTVGIPYIMQGLEKIYSSALKGRRREKIDQKVHNLIEYKRVLTLERENNEIRSSNRDTDKLINDNKFLEAQIEDLNQTVMALHEDIESSKVNHHREISNISEMHGELVIEKVSLEAKIEDLNIALKESNDNFTNSISLQQSINKSLKDTISQQQRFLDSLELQLELMSSNENIENFINKFGIDFRSRFLEFVNVNVFGTKFGSKLLLSEENEDQYINKGLAENENGNLSLTFLGKAVLTYLKQFNI